MFYCNKNHRNPLPKLWPGWQILVLLQDSTDHSAARTSLLPKNSVKPQCHPLTCATIPQLDPARLQPCSQQSTAVDFHSFPWLGVVLKALACPKCYRPDVFLTVQQIYGSLLILLLIPFFFLLLYISYNDVFSFSLCGTSWILPSLFTTT